MEEFTIRLAVIAIIIVTIIVIKLRSTLNKQKISETRKVNSDLIPFWQPGKESIMFFTNDNCHECEYLQKPALEQLQTKNTQIFTINVAEDLRLANYFRILTVPTTIILDNRGVPQFINQGYTNENILSEQLNQV
jgi:thiol-disulfide isomerase/thioredoxin